jgi:hypothetical protein
VRPCWSPSKANARSKENITMHNSSDPTVVDSSCTGIADLRNKTLSDAQLEFARLLGRLLAERWREEQRSTETTDRCLE